MAYSIKEQRESPAVRLRNDLDRAERLAPQLNGANVEEFLQLLDQIEESLEQLDESGLDLRPEETRRLGLHSRLERRPGDVVLAAAKAGGLAKLRQRNPPAAHFWWHLDKEVAARRWRMIRRLFVSVGAVILVLGGLYTVMRIFFPPDPDVLLASGATTDLSELALEQDWQAALAVVDETKAQLSRPDPELLIWEGVVAEQLGLSERSQQALEEARALLAPENEAEYWITLGNVWLNAGEPDAAESAAEQALALDPDLGQGYFLLGSVAEVRGDRVAAIEFYEETFQRTLNSNPQLAVLARVRAGTLMQQIEPPSATITTTVETP